jgi:hypothetical protein
MQLELTANELLLIETSSWSVEQAHGCCFSVVFWIERCSQQGVTIVGFA